MKASKTSFFAAALVRGKTAALAFVFLWFSVGGIAHFVAPEYFLKIVPPSLPLRLEAVYISGVFELLGASALWSVRLRRWAGYGLAALTLAVTPANVYMWKHHELFPAIPQALLGWRLVFQVVLLAIILWATRPAKLDNRFR
ncbi:DoxX family protein [Noviherbaspirillum galbum]|uniref:DoxX family membrane protein n=1 Tax=Noviherbaspirillum galbum TaxID=2709383 RepID=A0A6B3SZJ0_9BURK|nr:hypothetical protein [Noviherbaspirillum galbum]NEX64762.1 hypothetical protein [Noviherbaspirillum galbum]